MKLWAGRFQKETDTLVNDFNSSIGFDARLYQQDIRGSIAHAAMLGKQGIIEEHEAEKIIEGLKAILADIEDGKVEFSMDNEDIHMNIEAMLTQRIGDVQFDAIVGLESRGCLFGMPMAYNLHKAFIPIRKRGKLPRETAHISYDLEYGSAEIEVHKEDITPGMRVVVVDDLIATGGTLEAAIKLLEGLGAKVVKVVCLLELKGLHGRDRLAGYPTETVIAYEGK